MAYGDYILTTGEGRIGTFELVLGRFFYEREFAGRTAVLDLAAGRCWFAKQAPEVIQAVDLAPEIVARYAAEGIRITEGSAYAIPHEDERFDAVFCCWLFEHLEDPDRAMAEIRRVLRPGGLCFLVVPSDQQLRKGFWDDYTHVRPYTRVSLTQLAELNGFTHARAEHLVYTRFSSRVLPLVGPRRVLRYLRFADRTLRRLGVVNRNMVTLACRRPVT